MPAPLPTHHSRIMSCLLAIGGLAYSATATAQDPATDYADASVFPLPTEDNASEAEPSESLDPPPGYARDERGRLFQTSFDLRRRYYLGVYDMLRIYEDQTLRGNRHALMIEAGGQHEVFNPHTSRRHRHRFVQGRLLLAPFEIDALLYGYDLSRSIDEAPLWITTFIGEPRRFDVPIAVGRGGSVGRLHYRRTDLGDLMVLDLAEGHIGWEFYQGESIEDYVILTTGVGVGVIHREGAGRIDVYGAPEVGLRAAWTLTDDGLTQLAMQGRMQWAWNARTGEHWQMGSAQAAVEWSPLAINDQPITLFLAPELRYSQIPVAELQGVEVRGLLGLRLNLFVPPRHAELEARQ
ncbi:hypothetical protein DV096_14240 [Bradymonadaceae bacterium TMQ3]|nr:hypothetical protein DV096_14240 [Bradymonadaceae bacterium TMQ3]TXC75212.1 hypothetical protein FRC91_14110 [Bradymonadales bacterium TMQ1]